MKDFAKVFDVQFSQILYTKGIRKETPETRYTVDIRVDNEEKSYNMRIGFKEKQARDDYFENIDQKNATEAFKKMKHQLIF